MLKAKLLNRKTAKLPTNYFHNVNNNQHKFKNRVKNESCQKKWNLVELDQSVKIYLVLVDI